MTFNEVFFVYLCLVRNFAKALVANPQVIDLVEVFDFLGARVAI